MKTALCVTAAAAFALFSSTSNAAIVKFKATIDGKQEVPPVETTGTGTADLEFDDVTNELNGLIELTLPEGTKVTNQHIHKAKCGSTGNIARNLTTPGMNGVIAIDPPIKLDADLAKSLQAGELYINIHTEKVGTGELRGQIYRDDSTDTCPPTPGSNAGGTGGTGGSGGDGGAPTNATTQAADAGTTSANSSSSNGGGCSTTGAGAPGPAGGIAGAVVLGFATLAFARARKKR